MTNRVCIVGVGLMESDHPFSSLSHKELLYYATRKALDDAGLQREDIGGAITASYDFLEGRGLSNQYTLDSIGGVMKACDLRVAEDGLFALFAGHMEVLADPSGFIVVASVQKGSERDEAGLGFGKLIEAGLEPVFARPVCHAVPNPLGLEPILAAMEARSFLEKTGLSDEALARTALKNLNNARHNAGQDALELKDVLESDLLAWPIRGIARASATDAACALVICSEERAQPLNKKPVFIKGVGWASDTGHFALRSHGVSRETEWASRQAYDMAGIQDPVREIDVAEVNDWYPHRELMHCEALGFCGSNGLVERITEGAFEKEGELPVNPSGGLLGRGNAVCTAGLISAARVTEQLRGEANGTQVAGARTGLVHSWVGLPTASAGVMILGNG